MNTTAMAAGILGAFAASIAIFVVIGIAVTIITIIALWKIFTKMGEKGWKCIIPFYNVYILFKRTWSPKRFVMFLIVSIVFCICQIGVNAGCPFIGTQILLLISGVVMIVMIIMCDYHLCKSFGHGGGWTVGLIFLEFIFILMLAFGKSEYKGNVYLEEKGN